MLHTATDRAFVASILDAPDDDAPRLIYADWLDEQGECDRAEFIRLQIREARMSPDDPELPGVHARAEFLKRLHCVEWASRLTQFEGVHWQMFDRGFFKAVRFDHPDRFFAHAEAVFTAGPLDELRLHQFDNKHAARLANAPQLKSIRVLDLNEGNKIANLGIEELMRSRHLGNLLTLKLLRNNIGSAGVRAIAQSGHARSLRNLYLAFNDLFDDGLRYIAESGNLRNLKQLDLDRTLTGDEGVRALAAATHVRGIRKLFLSHNQITDEGLTVFSGSEAVSELRELFMAGNLITNVAALAESPRFANLQGLYLRQNQIRDDSAVALARSPYLAHIREMDLGENRISDQAGAELRSRFGARVNLY